MNEMFFDVSFPTLFIYTLHFELLDYKWTCNLKTFSTFQITTYVYTVNTFKHNDTHTQGRGNKAYYLKYLI